jgi:hypothetical protein
MLPQFKKDGGPGFRCSFQDESRGQDKEAEVATRAEGPIGTALRLSWPRDEATEGKWKHGHCSGRVAPS